MLSDLRKYISNDDHIVERSTAWYLKEFMERCKNAELVYKFLNKAKKNATYIIENEINPFEDLIDDYHLFDFIDVEENIIIKVLLSCVTTDFVVENLGMSTFEAFITLTKRGRNLSGYDGNEVLAEWVKSEWSDLENEFSGVSDELILKALETGSPDIDEGYEHRSMVITCDENNAEYQTIYMLLAAIGFTEVEPGLFYYACFGCLGYGGIDIVLDKENLFSVHEILEDIKKVRNLKEYSSTLNIFNISMGVSALFNVLGGRSSKREVLF